jgi:hypothetical protein
MTEQDKNQQRRNESAAPQQRTQRTNERDVNHESGAGNGRQAQSGDNIERNRRNTDQSSSGGSAGGAGRLGSSSSSEARR